MSTNGKDKSCRIRIRCSAANESGTCLDPKTFYLESVERAVFSGLKAEMRHPEVIAEYVRTYHEERRSWPPMPRPREGDSNAGWAN
jgi:hypothetical protein